MLAIVLFVLYSFGLFGIIFHVFEPKFDKYYSGGRRNSLKNARVWAVISLISGVLFVTVSHDITTLTVIMMLVPVMALIGLVITLANPHLDKKD